MKIGMIFECGPEGADLQVCRHLAQLVVPSVAISHVTLNTKPRLLSDCGKAAAGLLAESCRHVFVIWDLFPPWRGRKAKPCRRNDRAAIRRSLNTDEVDPAKVTLVCIEEELEAWLIADGRGVSRVLSTTAHPVTVRHISNAHRRKNPKAYLNRLFNQHRRGQYVDRRHALQIVQNIPDLNQLRRIPSFARFQERLLLRMKRQ